MYARTLTMTSIVILSFLCPGIACAKHKAPDSVPPVVWQGVEYRAPLDVGHLGLVQAFDELTGRMLWDKKVCHVWINPMVETDAQWLFVSDMQLQDQKLLVRREDGKRYRLYSSNGRIEGGMQNPFLCFFTGCFVIGMAVLV